MDISTNMASRRSRLRTLRKWWWLIVRLKLRSLRKAPAIALVAVIAVVISVVNASTAESGRTIVSPVAAPLPKVTGEGVTCNTAPAAEFGACVSRMLTDPNGAYAANHVYTDAEKQPVSTPQPVAAGAAAGTWSVVANCTVNGYAVNAIHASLTKSGKVLMTAGSGYNRSFFGSKIFKTWLWDPASPEICPREISMPEDVDLFCSGHLHLSDGRLLFFGGTGRYAAQEQKYTGVRQSYVFDDETEEFTPTGLMNVARWYPNGPVNAVGNPIVVGGLDANGKVTSINETYNPATGKWTKLPGRRLFPLYAGMVLRKTGTLCFSGANWGGLAQTSPGCWNWRNNAWKPIPGLPHPNCRDQANSLLLYPAQAQKVMVIGGGCARGVTGTTATVDLNAKSVRFTNGPYLKSAAMHSCATVLPDRSAFVAGGGDHNTKPRLLAARLPYGARAWQQLAGPKVARMYHSTCVLLPDGSVVTLGTTAPQGSVETRFEVYKPWYMQPGVVRPRLTGVSSTLKLGGRYQATYSGPASVTGATLTRLTSVTHTTDPNQRVVAVPVTRAAFGRVNLKIEANWGILPLGMYMLSLLDWRGIPSVSQIVRVVPAGAAAAGGSTPSTAGAACCCECGGGTGSGCC
ncbi:MAG: hypothetical protein QOH50_3412 [Kribbellaceae bacterium]|nr:hypothetical protein [Kribbellaceae bacterium]